MRRNSPFNRSPQGLSGRFNNHSFGRNRLSWVSPKSIILAFAVVAGAGLGGEYYMVNNTQEKVRFTVTDKSRDIDVYDGESTKKYLVHTVKDNGEYETYKVTDSIFAGRVTSSNTFAQLDKGCTYDATVYGWRNGWVSSYQNILEIDKVSCEPGKGHEAPLPKRKDGYNY